MSEPVHAEQERVLTPFEPSSVSSEELVALHTPLVRRIAFHLIARMPPTVQVDDLIQAGMIGLLEAAGNYDANHGASFETFAGIRIRGAMLDEIRRLDWAPRSLFRKMRQVSEAMREIEHEVARDARDSEVAEKMGITLESYHRILKDASGHRVFSTEDLGAGVDSIARGLFGEIDGPLENLEDEQFHESLERAISTLPEREKLVMSLYYDQELNLRQIGDLLGVTESRVCQIHGQAVLRLRARLRDWRETH
jgi:RNA polymerase sigma factor for flagellar operon FliA